MKAACAWVMAFAPQLALCAGPITSGDRELAFSGAFTRGQSAAFSQSCGSGSGCTSAIYKTNYTSLSAAVQGGYLLTRNHELGANVALRWFDYDFDSNTSGTAGLFYDYNFTPESGTVVPVAGAAVDKDINDPFGGNWALSASGGIRVFANDATSINVRAYWERHTYDGDYGSADIDTYGMRFGFSWFMH